MDSSAHFSPCRQFRYSLTRVWDANLPLVMFVGLNPSTADETTNDPTVRRCIGFAQNGRYGGMVLTNLFAFRSTDPKKLTATDDPIGPENDTAILTASSSVARVILAWGTHGSLRGRDQEVIDLIEDPFCLGTTKDGFPKHPLYLAASTKVRRFPRSTIRLKPSVVGKSEAVRRIA